MHRHCTLPVQGLRATDFIFLQEMFSLAPCGAVYVFMDASYKLWDGILAVAQGARKGAGSVRRYDPRCGFGNTMILCVEA